MKAQIVVNLVDDAEEGETEVLFRQSSDDEASFSVDALVLPVETWSNLGSPESLTVSVSADPPE